MSFLEPVKFNNLLCLTQYESFLALSINNAHRSEYLSETNTQEHETQRKNVLKIDSNCQCLFFFFCH
jgi:hypothetical protein